MFGFNFIDIFLFILSYYFVTVGFAIACVPSHSRVNLLGRIIDLFLLSTIFLSSFFILILILNKVQYFNEFSFNQNIGFFRLVVYTIIHFSITLFLFIKVFDLVNFEQQLIKE